jgi:trk system potassium uptake protein TrkH
VSGQFTSLRHIMFQIASILTTTNFFIADYSNWPEFCQALLLLLMFVGACTGSTGGSIKIGRYLIMLKRVKIEFNRMLHPKGVYSLKVGGKTVSNEIVSNVLVFFMLWMLFLLLGCALLTLCGDLNMTNAFLAAFSALTNLGPTFGPFGPTGNFLFLPAPAKFILSALMIIGRLEIYPVLLLFMFNFWKKE